MKPIHPIKMILLQLIVDFGALGIVIALDLPLKVMDFVIWPMMGVAIWNNLCYKDEK